MWAHKKTIALLVIVSVMSFFFWNQKVLGIQEVRSDASYYDRVAVNFLEGNGFTDKGEFQGITLGYESFLVSVYSIFGHNIDAVRYAQGVLFILIVLLVYAISLNCFGRREALIASFGLALFYVLPISSGVIGKEVLTAFFLLVFIFCLSQWFRFKKWQWALFSGLSLGLLTLTNGVTKFLFVPVALIILVYYFRGKALKYGLVNLSLFLISFLAVMSPWAYLNYTKTSAIGITQQAGGVYGRAEMMQNLYGQYPGHFIGMALGYYFAEKLYPNIRSTAFREVPQTEARTAALLKEGNSESQTEHILFKEGVAAILRNPHKYVLMTLLDFVSYFSPLVPHGQFWELNFTHLTFAGDRHNEIPWFIKTGYLLFIRLAWYAFLVCVILGLRLLFKREYWVAVGFLVVIAYFSIMYSLIHAIPRYAIALYPGFFILGGGGVVILWQWFMSRLVRH